LLIIVSITNLQPVTRSALADAIRTARRINNPKCYLCG